jgi:hypothetical protein
MVFKQIEIGIKITKKLVKEKTMSTFYGPLTPEEIQAQEAQEAAKERTAELAALPQIVEEELTASVSSVEQQMTQAMQSQMESSSKEIYDWGYTVFDGMTGKAATAASDKLRDLSAISGFDIGTLSIKMK